MPRPGELLTFVSAEVDPAGNSYDGISRRWINFNNGQIVMFIADRELRFLVLDGETLRTLDSRKWKPLSRIKE